MAEYDAVVVGGGLAGLVADSVLADRGKDVDILEQEGENSLGGLYAAGEAAGFGGDGYHGYNALEGTFLGDCILSGRQVGLAIR